jgi:DNA invertase Pin-like site-specific DNA recombinase
MSSSPRTSTGWFVPLRVQAELVSRVEKAGGKVLALDTGHVTNGSAGQWLSGRVLCLVAEYQRRTTAERSAEAQQRAIARGVPPWPNVPPGYTRGEDARLVPDERARGRRGLSHTRVRCPAARCS